MHFFLIAATRLRVATREKAEAEKTLQVKRAEGEAEAKYLSVVGVARSVRQLLMACGRVF